ncbi:MAG: symmetrical bis(5'-nucleosyl)-tetraphosphatase [Gammaproteobacteria bacterium]
MADYAIGDVQGCFDSLRYLLDKIQYNEREDRLWFVGDLVNRGPKSLEVLRFIKNLPIPARICLGNHDLHLLSLVYTDRRLQPYDPSLQQILDADDCEELCAWLTQQPLLHFDPDLNVVMVHAGIAPQWNLAEAQAYAKELEQVLNGPERNHFLQNMYGNIPNAWSDESSGIKRLRLICNYFTRMRFCFVDGSLDLEYDGTVDKAPKDLYPWYETPNRQAISASLVFGHWAALAGQCFLPGIFALDTGCVWGGSLTALHLQDQRRVGVPAQEKK